MHLVVHLSLGKQQVGDSCYITAFTVLVMHSLQLKSKQATHVLDTRGSSRTCSCWLIATSLSCSCRSATHTSRYVAASGKPATSKAHAAAHIHCCSCAFPTDEDLETLVARVYHHQLQGHQHHCALVFCKSAAGEHTCCLRCCLVHLLCQPLLLLLHLLDAAAQLRQVPARCTIHQKTRSASAQVSIT